jgi:sugar phosphate isomerase/epimerase
MVCSAADATGIETAAQLEELGYDYIELSLSDTMALSENDFIQVQEKLRSSGLPCEACHNFFPPELRLTGDRVDSESVERYVTSALQRAALLAVRVVVFGSAQAKNVPPDFPKDEAWRQIAALLRNMDPVASHHGITVVIEPINRQESNIINSVAEGLKMAREVDRPSIRLLADYYHIAMEKEPLENLREAGEYIQHVHFAEPKGRCFPQEDLASYRDFFSCLERIDYGKRISIEAYSENFPSDAQKALRLLVGLAETDRPNRQRG